MKLLLLFLIHKSIFFYAANSKFSPTFSYSIHGKKKKSLEFREKQKQRKITFCSSSSGDSSRNKKVFRLFIGIRIRRLLINELIRRLSDHFYLSENEVPHYTTFWIQPSQEDQESTEMPFTGVK